MICSLWVSLKATSLSIQLIKGGVLKVSKGARVLLKGLRRETSIFYKGFIITVFRVVSVTPFDDGFAHLFHAWLDHMRKKKGLIKSIPLAKSRGCLHLASDIALD